MSFATMAPFLIGVGALLVLMLGLAGLFKAFYRKVDQGVAVIVNDMSAQPKVLHRRPDHSGAVPRRADADQPDHPADRPPWQGRPDLPRQHARRHRGGVLPAGQ
ncbi:hypothetical protein D9M71_690580 [compost metagenome]